MGGRDLPTVEQLDGTKKVRPNGDGTVLKLEMRRTDSKDHPCGWVYALHYGLRASEDAPILRYDNAHERAKGHERHTLDGTEQIEFPGMVELYDRFRREYNDLRGVAPR